MQPVAGRHLSGTQPIHCIAAGKRVKVLLVTNPDNPTGKVYSREQLSQMLSWCLENSVHYIRCAGDISWDTSWHKLISSSHPWEPLPGSSAYLISATAREEARVLPAAAGLAATVRQTALCIACSPAVTVSGCGAPTIYADAVVSGTVMPRSA